MDRSSILLASFILRLQPLPSTIFRPLYSDSVLVPRSTHCPHVAILDNLQFTYSVLLRVHSSCYIAVAQSSDEISGARPSLVAQSTALGPRPHDRPVAVTLGPAPSKRPLGSVLYGLFPTVRRAFSVSDVTVQTAVHSLSCVHATVMSLYTWDRVG
jgi:hypothetical protein